MAYTFPALIERVASLPTGGYVTVESRLDPGYLKYLINSARAFIVCERWKQYGKVPPIYYQPFFPVFDKQAQSSDGCFTTFYNVPDIIALDGRASGLGYIGSQGELNQFREISSKAALSSMMNNRVVQAKTKPLVLIEGGGIIKIYANDTVRLPEMNAIFFDPEQVPTYNIDYDTYPMDISDIPKMENYLMQGSFQLLYKTPINRVNDGRDVTVPPNPLIKQ